MVQPRKFRERVRPPPAYQGHLLLFIYYLGRMVPGKAGGFVPQAYSHTPPLPNAGKVARFSWLGNSGPLIATHHLSREPAIFKELLQGTAWLSASCTTFYLFWPLSSFQGSHPQGLTLTFFNCSTPTLSSDLSCEPSHTIGFFTPNDDLEKPNLFFPVVTFGCEGWTIKKAEHQRIDAFELWCWRRLLKVPWTARRSNQSILKEISP